MHVAVDHEIISPLQQLKVQCHGGDLYGASINEGPRTHPCCVHRWLVVYNIDDRFGLTINDYLWVAGSRQKTYGSRSRTQIRRELVTSIYRLRCRMDAKRTFSTPSWHREGHHFGVECETVFTCKTKTCMQQKQGGATYNAAVNQLGFYSARQRRDRVENKRLLII